MPKIFNADNQKKAENREQAGSGHKQQIPVNPDQAKSHEGVIFQSGRDEVSQHPQRKPDSSTQYPLNEHINDSAQQSESNAEIDPVENLAEHSETLNGESATKNPFRSYAPKPLNIQFGSQLKNEKIILMLRKHPATQIGKIIIILIFFLIPIVLLMSPAFDLINNRLKMAAVVGWYAMLITYSLEAFLLWFFHVFFITNKRIIDVDFTSLIYKEISFAKIGRIEDVTTTTAGLLASMLDYGTVYIQTAATQAQIEFEEIPHPNKVSQVLKELMYVYKRLKYGLKVSK